MPGHYELHVTVENKSPISHAYLFSDYCVEKLHCKCNLIQLQSHGGYSIPGEESTQLMLAMKSDLNNDEEALEWGRVMTEYTKMDAWNPLRTKVESPLNEGPSVYFEAHWKLSYPTEKSTIELKEFLHFVPGFMRSWNILKPDTHYLSMRSYQPDFHVAQQLFDKGHGEINDSGLPLENVHYERVIIDTRPEMDKNWL